MSSWSTLVASLGMDFWGRFGETSGTTLNDTANSHNGTWEGGITLGGTGLVANDSDGAVVFPNDALKFGAIPYGSWLNRSTYSLGVLFATTSTAAQLMVQRWGSTSGNQVYAIDLSTSNLVRGYARINNATQLISATVTGLRDGNRHLLALDWDGTTLRLYVDGTSVASSTPGGSQKVDDVSSGVTIGRRTGVTTTPFNGTLDELFFGPSLSSGNHAALWAAANAPAPVTVNGTHITETTTVHSGAVVMGVTIAGTHISETTTVRTGVAKVGALVVGAHVTETTTVRSGTVIEGVVKPGSHITETTTVHSGSVTVGAVVSGSHITETTTVNAGTTLLPTFVAGSHITETTTVYTGDVIEATGVTITGSHVTEVTTVRTATVVLGYATTVRNGTSGRRRGGTGYASWFPAVVPVPVGGGGSSAREAVDKARAFGAVTIVGNQPTFASIDEMALPRQRDRVVIRGRDATYFRGAEVVVSDYQLMQPFGYGTATLYFKQINPAYEQLGVGDLDFLAPDGAVTIQRVNDATNEVEATDFRGYLHNPISTSDGLRYEIIGQLSGPAAIRHKPMALVRSSTDLGRALWRLADQLGVRVTPRLGPETGIEVGRFGDMSFLEGLQSYMGRAWTKSGNQWTLMPDWTTPTYSIYRRNRTTPDGTAYLSAGDTTESLQRDRAAEPNRIFGTGVAPSGKRIRNGNHPGVFDGDFDFPGFLEEGDSGPGVLAMIQRLRITGYINAETAPGGFDADVTDAIESLQEKAGLNVTGNVNEATWNAIFSVAVNGADLTLSRVEPMAQLDATRKYNLSPDGAIISRNEDYDPSVLKIDEAIDFGTGFTRQQMRKWSRKRKQEAQTPNWAGTLRIETGAIVAGEHTPGDPITSILRARDIRPGMNIWLPQFQGGTLVHVTAAAWDGSIVTLQVDTRARDAWTVAQVIERNREARSDPAGAFFRELNTSRVGKDAILEFSEIGGIIEEQPLRGGEWNVFKMVAGDSGTIQSIDIDTNPNAESVVAFFGRRVWPNVLQQAIGNPLSSEGTARWQDEDVYNRLRRDHYLLHSAGNADEPGGYSPGYLGPEGTGIFTGRLSDDAGFAYYTEREPVLYVAMWVDRDCVIPAGRIAKPLLEPGS